MAEEFGRGGHVQAEIRTVAGEVEDLAAGVDVPGHEVSAEAVGGQEARLDVDQVSGAEVAQVGQAQGLGEQVEGRLIAGRVDHGQAAAVGRDAVAGLRLAQQGMPEGEAGALAAARLKGDDLGGSLDQSGEHRQ